MARVTCSNKNLGEFSKNKQSDLKECDQKNFNNLDKNQQELIRIVHTHYNLKGRAEEGNRLVKLKLNEFVSENKNKR